MRKSFVSPQPQKVHYSDLETDRPPAVAQLPFAPKTDIAILRAAVRSVIARRPRKAVATVASAESATAN
jgi:hypothetical protein